MTRIKSIFDSLSLGKQQRVSEDSVLEFYLRKEKNGLLSLRFNGSFTPKNITCSDILKVEQTKFDEGYSIFFIYRASEDSEKNDIFYTFCKDITTYSKNYTDIIKRYKYWQNMFKPNSNLLDRNEIMGLIGEMIHLEYMINKYGETAALSSWIGVDMSPKDFIHNDTYYEVKAIDINKESVNISSLAQLDSEGLKFGYLAIITLESGGDSALSINKLYQDICSKIADTNTFNEKLQKRGFAPCPIYDIDTFIVKYKSLYSVDNNFPRLIASNVPQGIEKASYTISLQSLQNYRIKYD